VHSVERADNDNAGSDFEKQWRRRFEQFAALRDDDAGIAGWSSSGLEVRFRFFTSLWQGGQSGGLYIDVGCGAGTYSRWLADAGLRVIGVDYSHHALLKAQQRCSNAIAFCAADAAHLPLPNQSVDGVLCFGLLQAVWDSKPAIDEMARIIKPGGQLWIDALNASGLWAFVDTSVRRLRGRPLHLRYEYSRRLMSELRAAGFSDVSRHWLPIMPNSMKRLQTLSESRPFRSVLNSVPAVGALLSHSFVIRGVRGRKQ
jgi:ubiquinone/menaquinone biosynthesis C-methylase UbiE